jgi:hypothetical protein
VPLTLPPSMAPPTTFGGETGSQAFRDFVRIVSGGTGLSPQVVTAWVLAENSTPEKTRATNPLNIGGASRSFSDYKAAAAATVTVLHGPKYAPVLRAAKSGNDATVVAAIAASPWDACHYRGTNPDRSCVNAPPGTSLLGVLHRVQKSGVHDATTPGAVTVPTPSSIASDVGGAVSGAVGQAEAWLASSALTGLAYVGLTSLALVLVLAGVMRATGIGPKDLLHMAGGREGAGEGIPF